MTRRPVARAACTVVFLPVLLSPIALQAAAKTGLEGAQDLFRKSHWEEARALLRSQWGAVPEKDRPAASFLIGRSYAREAEFYGALRGFSLEVGLAYLEELASVKGSRSSAWITLFKGLYQLEAERNAEAERTLLDAASQLALPQQWRAAARARRGVALARLGRSKEAAALKDATADSRFGDLLTSGVAEPPPAPSKDRQAEKLMAAAILFRAGRGADAEALLAGVNLDLPDVEDKADPRKLLRFHDPVAATAWERICWERSVAALKPLASGGAGVERALATYYVGLGLFHLGAAAESTGFLKEASLSSLSPELRPAASVLLASALWKAQTPAAELASLWEGTRSQPDAVLLWDELRRGDLAKTEPFATKLDAQLRDLLQASSDRPAGALVGRWGLARLRRRDDPAALVSALSEYRDKSNKNKIEWNDPLLLLALCVADYRDQEYVQALETLFELSKTFPGLRPLQWNLQGIYAARQKAGGEARISQ